ncbi:hypothetical protein B0H65DRAFT_206622 [Neurospora tetraspora]|uniref:Uncharacterized protein n=1 Tax=Neurospora tetraspora TaxID=94610 RepID=A0AAE0JFL2_9PEZI|nr:hypothetical protein B0H65DRAFT_206622 [Neurospora tetraspora]
MIWVPHNCFRLFQFFHLLLKSLAMELRTEGPQPKGMDNEPVKATVQPVSATVWGHTNLSPETGLASLLRACITTKSSPKVILLNHDNETSKPPFSKRSNSHSHAGASRRPPAPPELILTNPNR